MSQSIYQRTTDAIVGHLLTTRPDSWECTWHRGSLLPMNAATSRPYRGINILTLWASAVRFGYSDPRWATYKQWSDLGAQVRKGERSSLCVFYKPPGSRGDKAPGASPEREREANPSRLVLRLSNLFNAAQVDGLAVENVATPPAEPIEMPPIFDNFIEATGARIVHNGAAACFIPASDEIHMPERRLFRSAAGYVTTLCHELTHWTGAKHRLDRDLAGRFGSQSYAAEELVAELGSAFVPASLGLASEPPPNHAAYIASWLPLVKSDPRALFTAASHASRATDWLLAASGVESSAAFRGRLSLSENAGAAMESEAIRERHN